MGPHPLPSTLQVHNRAVGCNTIFHENTSGKRAASEGAGLNVGRQKRGKGR